MLLDTNQCAAMAQIIPILLLVVAVGEGSYLRHSSGTVVNKIIFSVAILIAGTAETFAVFGVLLGGISSYFSTIVIGAAAGCLCLGIAFDLIMRIWESD